jgi:uncharacterized protein
VVRRTAESSVITSFELVAADGQALPAFEPGQFLTFLVDPADEGAGTRTYSLSGDPAATGTYRISVKREAPPAGRPDLPPGRMSTALHDHVAVGDVLAARGPEGRFVLDGASTRPVVLLAGGVGATPLVAMAHSLAAQGTRPTWFIHASESRDVQAFGAEMRALAARCDLLTVHTLYRTAAAGDVRGVHHDSEGLLSRAVLQRLLPLDDYDVYLCGPTPFMEAAYGLLTGLGVPDARIACEFFGPATVLRRTAPPQPPTETAAAPQPAAGGGADIVVTFARSGRSAVWSDTFATLLDFAEAQGLAPPFSCRAGICSTCACEVLQGEVAYVAEPLDLPPAGVALLCCARPRSALALAL